MRMSPLTNHWIPFSKCQRLLVVGVAVTEATITQPTYISRHLNCTTARYALSIHAACQRHLLVICTTIRFRCTFSVQRFGSITITSQFLSYSGGNSAYDFNRLSLSTLIVSQRGVLGLPLYTEFTHHFVTLFI